jgi:D-tyrosyl-tRNA(Tyr) deacylase
MTQTQFGGGLIAPQLLAHLKKADSRKTTAKTEFGGGLIAPQLAAHLKSAKVEFGGGLVHPRLARLIAR